MLFIFVALVYFQYGEVYDYVCQEIPLFQHITLTNLGVLITHALLSCVFQFYVRDEILPLLIIMYFTNFMMYIVQLATLVATIYPYNQVEAKIGQAIL